MNRFRPAVMILLLSALLGMVGVGAYGVGREGVALAQETGQTRCSTATLNGDYSMAGQGFLGRVPFAFVGVLKFDGKGRFSGHHEESIGGNYGPSTEAGDYSVGPDCMGITHWTDHPPHTGLPPHNHTIVFVVTQGGNEVSFLGIDNSPPGQFHSEIPEPDIEFWGTLKRL
jgi:hypothetical protein